MWSTSWRLLRLSLCLLPSVVAGSESFMHCRNVFPKIRDFVRASSSDSDGGADDWSLGAHHPQGRLASYRRHNPEFRSFPQYVFPEGLGRHNFANLEDLCAHNLAYGNAGCKCVDDPAMGSSAINCFPNPVGTPNHLDLFTLYRFWCRHFCQCQSTKDYEDQKPVQVASDADWEELRDFSNDPFADVSRPFSIERQPESGAWKSQWYGESIGSTQTCDIGLGEEVSGKGPTRGCGQCNERCWGPQDCHSQLTGCNCKPRRKKTSKGLVWQGICSISTGKRNLEPCLCNVSYISQSCCGKPDGTVWEGPEMFLGAISDMK